MCQTDGTLEEAYDIFCYPLQLLQEKNVSEFVALEQPCVANLVAAAWLVIQQTEGHLWQTCHDDHPIRRPRVPSASYFH